MRFRDWFYKEETQNPDALGQPEGPNKIQVTKSTQTLANKYASVPKNATTLTQNVTNALSPKLATAAAMQAGADALKTAPPNLAAEVKPVNVASFLFKDLTGRNMPQPPNLKALG